MLRIRIHTKSFKKRLIVHFFYLDLDHLTPEDESHPEENTTMAIRKVDIDIVLIRDLPLEVQSPRAIITAADILQVHRIAKNTETAIKDCNKRSDENYTFKENLIVKIC